MKNKIYGTQFCGNEASDSAKENGRLDYSTDAMLIEPIKSYKKSYNDENIYNTHLSEIGNVLLLPRFRRALFGKKTKGGEKVTVELVSESDQKKIVIRKANDWDYCKIEFLKELTQLCFSMNSIISENVSESG